MEGVTSYSPIGDGLNPPVLGPPPVQSKSGAKFWLYQQFVDYESKANPNAREKDDPLPYLEHSDGTTFTKEEAKHLSKRACMLFTFFAKLGVAPVTWGKVDDRTADFFYKRLYVLFPDLRHCALDWKVEAWATHNYSWWHKYHIRDAAVPVANAKRTLPLEEPGAGTTSKPAKRARKGARKSKKEGLEGLLSFPVRPSPAFEPLYANLLTPTG